MKQILSPLPLSWLEKESWNRQKRTMWEHEVWAAEIKDQGGSEWTHLSQACVKPEALCFMVGTPPSLPRFSVSVSVSPILLLPSPLLPQMLSNLYLGNQMEMMEQVSRQGRAFADVLLSDPNLILIGTLTRWPLWARLCLRIMSSSTDYIIKFIRQQWHKATVSISLTCIGARTAFRGRAVCLSQIRTPSPSW